MSAVKIDEKAILDAAAEEFAEKGFSGARVDKIAKRASIWSGRTLSRRSLAQLPECTFSPVRT